jgi:hypothetical protein
MEVEAAKEIKNLITFVVPDAFGAGELIVMPVSWHKEEKSNDSAKSQVSIFMGTAGGY